MKFLSSLIFCTVLPLLGNAETTDPAPPKFNRLEDQPVPTPQSFDRLTFHQAPKPLSKVAKTADWPRVLGPSDNVTSPETHLLHEWPKEGPTLCWEVQKGDAYTSPAIVGEFLVIFHALEGKETVECLQAETGKRFWSYDYPISYKDRYGFANGPRGSPVIAQGRVVTMGVTCVLTCLESWDEHECRCGAKCCPGYIAAEEYWPQLRKKAAARRGWEKRRRMNRNDGGPAIAA